jgi:hypothetical protein
VSSQSELAELGGGLQRGVQGALSAGRHDEVGDHTAFDADEVVMVTDEVFVEFVSCVIVASRNSMHDTGLFEVGQVAVDRTLCQLRAMLQQLRDAGRVPDIEQSIYELASTAGVHEVFRAQTAPDFGVNALVCCRHCDERTCDESVVRW